MRVAFRQIRCLVSGLLLALMAFGMAEGVALAQSDPAQQQAAQAAFAKHEAAAAFACPGAVAARAANRHYFTLAEARQCAPGAAVSDTSRFSLRILPTSNFSGYSQTLIVGHGANQYSILRLTNLDGLAAPSRTALASGCPEVSTWNVGGWGPVDIYINNQTRWYRDWPSCGSGAQAAWAYINPTCSSFWPFSVNSCRQTGYNDWTKDAYTDVTGIYGCFCAGATVNAWQEMIWDSRGWWDFYGWETGN